MIWAIWSRFPPRMVKTVRASISSHCLASDILTDIALGSTSKPIMGIHVPQIWFTSSSGRLISSQSWSRATWSEGRKVSYSLYSSRQIMFENGDPQHKRNEGSPDFLGSVPTEVITAVNAKLTINVNNLLDLPKRVHRHLTVGSSNI